MAQDLQTGAVKKAWLMGQTFAKALKLQTRTLSANSAKKIFAMVPTKFHGLSGCLLSLSLLSFI
jgi:hypothetical protein